MSYEQIFSSEAVLESLKAIWSYRCCRRCAAQEASCKSGSSTSPEVMNHSNFPLRPIILSPAARELQQVFLPCCEKCIWQMRHNIMCVLPSGLLILLCKFWSPSLPQYIYLYLYIQIAVEILGIIFSVFLHPPVIVSVWLPVLVFFSHIQHASETEKRQNDLENSKLLGTEIQYGGVIQVSYMCIIM